MVDMRVMTYISARYVMVNEETVSFYHEMVAAEGWDRKTEFIVDKFNDIHQKVRETNALSHPLMLILTK